MSMSQCSIIACLPQSGIQARIFMAQNLFPEQFQHSLNRSIPVSHPLTLSAAPKIQYRCLLCAIEYFFQANRLS